MKAIALGYMEAHFRLRVNLYCLYTNIVCIDILNQFSFLYSVSVSVILLCAFVIFISFYQHCLTVVTLLL